MENTTVIGGGAAGMMAAISAAKSGHEVLLIEKNEKLGKKIYITGKGRCNVTNACDFDEFQRSIVTNSRFMFSSLRGFFNDDLMAMIEEAGCPLKTERGERVFPVSDKASDITKALERILRELKVRIRLNTEVKELIKRAPSDSDSEGSFEIRCEGKTGKPEIYLSKNVIVCTGGLSYRTTGSTGDGYRFAEEYGHEIKEPVPALVPLTLLENDAKDMQGLSLRNIEIRISPIRDEKATIYSDFGEMLFTHFGVSGPVILSASSYITNALRDGERFVLHIDLKPALSPEKLDERILRDFDEAKNTDIQNAISKLIISSLRLPVLKQAGIDPHKKVRDIKRAEREALSDSIKGLSFTVNGTRGYNEAVVTSGGVSIKEIDPKTMEVKGHPGLYFAGEVVDVHGYTGGFNIGVAAAMGHAAGTACARR